MLSTEQAKWVGGATNLKTVVYEWGRPEKLIVSFFEVPRAPNFYVQNWLVHSQHHASISTRYVTEQRLE